MSEGRTGVRLCRLAAGPLFVLAGPLSAQSLSGTGLAYNVQHRVLYQGVVGERTGLWFGGEGAVQAGPIRVGVAGLLGSLGGDTSRANPEATVRATSLTLHFAVAPGVLVGAEVEARRFEADVGTTAWRLIGANARLAAPLGVPGLVATADASYFASASVVGGQETITPAFRATLGAGYQARGALRFQVGYRFERFDFEPGGTGPARKEQFRGVLAGIGLRLGRR
jgi:hypothetical protein